MLGRTKFSSLFVRSLLSSWYILSTLHWCCNKVPVRFHQHCGGRRYMCVKSERGVVWCKSGAERDPVSLQEKGERAAAVGERGVDGESTLPREPNNRQPTPITTLSLSLPQDASCRKAGSHRLKATISTAPPCQRLMLPNGSKDSQREREKVELLLLLQMPE